MVNDLTLSAGKRLVAVTLLVAALSFLANSSANAQLIDSNASASFNAQGNKLHMTGVIDRRTLGRLKDALSRNPSVQVLVLHDVPGSDDDDAAMGVYREVRRRGLSTYVPKNGVVASGGVDLFCAGTYRKVETGGKLLVHPWATGQGFSEVTGDRVPRNDPRHRFYLDYYEEMGVDPNFYWHTLNAPRRNVAVENGYIPDMHLMTRADLERFNVVTEKEGTPQEEPDVDEPIDPKPNKDLGFLVGTWTFPFNSQTGTIKIEQDGEFEYKIPSLKLNGMVDIDGMTLVLLGQGFEYEMEVVRATNNQIQFTNAVWSKSHRPQVDDDDDDHDASSLDGQWMEVRTDGRSSKFIEIDGSEMMEMSQRGSEMISLSVQGDKMTLRYQDGEVETLQFKMDGSDTIKFINSRTRHVIPRFHWKRFQG